MLALRMIVYRTGTGPARDARSRLLVFAAPAQPECVTLGEDVSVDDVIQGM